MVLVILSNSSQLSVTGAKEGSTSWPRPAERCKRTVSAGTLEVQLESPLALLFAGPSGARLRQTRLFL